jgi:hypothetical protein
LLCCTLPIYSSCSIGSQKLLERSRQLGVLQLLQLQSQSLYGWLQRHLTLVHSHATT